MDIHRSIAQVAIHAEGITAKSFRIELDHDAVVAFGKSLWPDDAVVLEATGNTAAIVRLLSPFVHRVVIANPLQVKAIAHARGKTDKVDAAILAQLHAAGFLPEVWARMTRRWHCGDWSRSAPLSCAPSAGRRAGRKRGCTRT